MATHSLTESFLEDGMSDVTDFNYVTESPSNNSSVEFDTDCEDIDDSDFESDEEDKPWTSIKSGIRTYRQVCRQLNVRPIRRVIIQLPQMSMNLRHVKMNNGQCQALIQAILNNSCIESIELQDNGLSEDSLVDIMNVINDSRKISSLGLAGNEMQTEGARIVDDVLKKITCLTHLNLAGCKLGDNEIEYIGSGLESNYGLKWLDLSHNRISVQGGKKLGKAIEDTPNLYYLNLSWNHIRLDGAVALIHGLQWNSSICTLDLGMNGLGFDGCLALEDALRENSTLRYFDISNNRIDWDCVTFIANGLKRNSTLEVLKIGTNPINMAGCIELLEAVSLHGSRILKLDLKNIPVNRNVLTLAGEIASEREFFLTHGRILDCRDTAGIKKGTRVVDHTSFLLRFLAGLEVRYLPDLFRLFDRHRDGNVLKRDFIRVLKEYTITSSFNSLDLLFSNDTVDIRRVLEGNNEGLAWAPKVDIPLTERELLVLSSNLDKHKTGFIHYSVLCQDVKNHARDRDRRAKEKSEATKVKQTFKKAKK